MNKVVILGLLVSFATVQLSAMEEKNKAALTFTVAQKGEDLGAYQEILLKVYAEYATHPGMKEPLKESLIHPFAVLQSWIGQKGKRFIKAHDGETPVGFLTLEALNEDETHIAFHQSPLLPEYLHNIPRYFACVKREFPHAKVVYTACSDRVTKMQELVKKLGFVVDSSYLPNKELVPNSAGFLGYKKTLE